MYKFLVNLLFVVSISQFTACSDTNNSDIASNAENCEKPIVNPNGDSELALVMRQMHQDTKKLKKQIEAGNHDIPESFINLLKEIEAAAPTKPEVKTPAFAAYSKLINEQAASLSQNKKFEVTDYNNFIDKCLNCHQTYCPGPMKTISKLKLSDSKVN